MRALSVRTIIFDVDGTLYKQRSLRYQMLKRLALFRMRNPGEGRIIWRVLRAYRAAQEQLRRCQPVDSGLAEAQIELASRATGVERLLVAEIVDRWMERSPMDLFSTCLRQDLIPFLRKSKEQGIALGIFSDYPASRKLASMRLEGFFDVVVSAQDVEVQRFKPDPRGLEVTLERLGGERRTALYVGDRPEVDGIAAIRAGMRCVIVGARFNGAHPGGWNTVRSFAALADTL